MRQRDVILLCLALLANLAPPTSARRGGGGFGRSMGRSRGRGSSGARTSVFGGSRSGGSRPATNTGWGAGSSRGHSSGGFGNSRTHGSSSNWGMKPRTSTHGGGFFNRNKGQGFGRSSSFTRGRGTGSMFRSNTFKNAIVGAAAGYLTYQAGKAIIRAAAGPMMWNNRPYYWGSNYYRQRSGEHNMCRMPIQPNDQQFGNVYFQDQTRPREIVWGCGWGEYCCGYECCRGGGASPYGISMGTIILLFVTVFCFIPLLIRHIRQNGCGPFYQGRAVPVR